jgi:hypothetical protein
VHKVREAAGRKEESEYSSYEVLYEYLEGHQRGTELGSGLLLVGFTD